MSAKDGVYTGFVISDEKDILDLKNRIKYYKPISQNDIAFLHRKLEKRGKNHLVKFFEKHIMGMDYSHKIEQTEQPKKKEKPSIEKEVYRTKKCKASDFQFYDKEIRLGKYILNTERAFSIPSSILQKIEGEFIVRIHSDKTFYIDNHGLSKLLYLVEDYCFSYLDNACDEWIYDMIDSIEKDINRYLYLDIKNFALNETNGKYELKDDAIKYCLISKEVLRRKFREFVNDKTNIPQIYRDKYKLKFPYAEQVDKFNEEFTMNLKNIIRKYVYYTQEDLEVVKWRDLGYYKPLICVDFKLTDDDSNKGIIEWISTDSFFYYQKIELNITQAPRGALYGFSDEMIRAIEETIESLKEDSSYDLFNACIRSVKTKQSVQYETDKYISNYSTVSTYDDKYIYKVDNPLLDISDKHYLIGHPKVEDYTFYLNTGYVNKIACFWDPNYMLSQDLTGKYVPCYLLANDEYVVLYALDYSKSTYVFKVKKGCIEMAMFFIWAYFSSWLYNKREGKSLRVERLFSYFGIEWYDNTGSHISKNDEGLYQFILPICFYNKI